MFVFVYKTEYTTTITEERGDTFRKSFFSSVLPDQQINKTIHTWKSRLRGPFFNNVLIIYTGQTYCTTRFLQFFFSYMGSATKSSIVGTLLVAFQINRLFFVRVDSRKRDRRSTYKNVFFFLRGKPCDRTVAVHTDTDAGRVYFVLFTTRRQ